jgi:5-methyltetrahydrofolate--homocysteine methyltransferase
MGPIEELLQSILKGNITAVEQYTKTELEKGIFWSDIFENTLSPLMDKIGQEFSEGTCFLPELIATGDAVSRAVEAIRESLGDIEIESKGTIVMGTIFEDIHDIGKNIVIMNLEGAGFKVVDLGIDVRPDQFVKSCRENKADLVGISALLSTTMVNLAPAIKQIHQEAPGVKILVGGNPITPGFAKKIEADGYAPDGYQAVLKAKELLNIS